MPEIIWSQITLTEGNLEEATRIYNQYADKRTVDGAELVVGNKIITQTIHFDDPFSPDHGARVELHWLCTPMDAYIKFREVRDEHTEDDFCLLTPR